MMSPLRVSPTPERLVSPRSPQRDSRRMASHILICLFMAAVAATPTTPSHQGSLLELRNCTKTELQQLPNIAAITELSAVECDIPELENAFFIRCSNLNALEITDSGLTTLEDYAFHGLKQLKSLSLVRNNISEVKSWSNEPMNALIALDLRRNAIRELTLKSFVRYPNLQRLNLAVNLLENIADDVFSWMPHLKYLNLGRNHLKTIDVQNFDGMHRLSHLALHYNELIRIDVDAFQTNTHLRSLRLEGNRLADLEFMSEKNLVRLVHLNLSSNAIDSLDRLTFSKDYELTVLDLSYNRLSEVLVDTFAGLESLECLNISHNSLQRIEAQSFRELSNLRHIDVSANNLTQLPVDTFNGSRLLQYINLAGNAFHDINVTLLAHLPFLRVVDLSANRLHTDAFIEFLADELNRGELTLDLSDNRFSLLNMTTLMNFERVELAGNRWNCKWLIQEMLRTPQTVHFGRNYSLATEWSSALLNVTGIDCYDEHTQRSIVVLNTGRAWEHRVRSCNCDDWASGNISPPPLTWPKVRLDKFDSRSIIIWMLITIALVFAGLRIARKLLDRREHKRLQRQLVDKNIKPSVLDKLKAMEGDVSEPEYNTDTEEEQNLKNEKRKL